MDNERGLFEFFECFIFLEATGGESGIRTHETREGLPVFKTGAFNRSAICPVFANFAIFINCNKFFLSPSGNGKKLTKLTNQLLYYLASLSRFFVNFNFAPQPHC